MRGREESLVTSLLQAILGDWRWRVEDSQVRSIEIVLYNVSFQKMSAARSLAAAQPGVAKSNIQGHKRSFRRHHKLRRLHIECSLPSRGHRCVHLELISRMQTTLCQRRLRRDHSEVKIDAGRENN